MKGVYCIIKNPFGHNYYLHLILLTIVLNKEHTRIDQMTYVPSFNVLFVMQPTSSVVVRRGFAPVRKLDNNWGSSEIVISNDLPFLFPNIQINLFFENNFFSIFYWVIENWPHWPFKRSIKTVHFQFRTFKLTHFLKILFPRFLLGHWKLAK